MVSSCPISYFCLHNIVQDYFLSISSGSIYLSIFFLVFCALVGLTFHMIGCRRPRELTSPVSLEPILGILL